MNVKRDYYEILGVPKNAKLEQIRKAYREKALRHHPDRVSESEKKAAEEKFKEISEAFAVLSDPQKRGLYDQYGHPGIDQKYAYEDIFKGTDFNTIFQDLSEYGFGENLFDQIFGDFGFDLSGKYKKSRPHTHNVKISVELTLEEAAQGCEKKITVPRFDPCPTCSGTGAKPGSKMILCPECHGKGQVQSKQSFLQIIQTCPECKGAGKIIETLCTECQGEGRVRVTRHIFVKIPPGVDTGSELRVHHEGEGGQGDLYIEIEIKSHPLFIRKGDDLIILQTVPLTIAVLGGEIVVPTLFNHVTMKIPSGTQSGAKFRIKGKGMPKLNQLVHGDEYVIIGIEIPTQLTPEQRQLMEAFAKASGHAAA